MTKQPNSSDIIILHGWGSSPVRWDQIKKILNRKNTRIFVPFLPGFNPKSPAKKPLTVRGYSDWLALYIKENEIKNPTLIGHSNGGRIAIYFTSRFDLVSKLVLFAAAGIPNNKESLKKHVFGALAKFGKSTLSLLKNPHLEKFAQKTLYKLARESDYFKASPVMKKTMQNVLKYDATEDLMKIKTPTLCVWGRNDTATPLWMGERMNKLLPNSRLEIINGGHNLHRTHVEELGNVIKKFI